MKEKESKESGGEEGRIERRRRKRVEGWGDLSEWGWESEIEGVM